MCECVVFDVCVYVYEDACVYVGVCVSLVFKYHVVLLGCITLRSTVI